MAPVILVVLGLSVLLALSISWVTWRQRPQPGTATFSVGMDGLTWLLGSLLIGNGAAPFDASEIAFAFLRLNWLGTNVMVLGWFFFALAYTGREGHVTRRVVAVISIVPAISGVLVLASDRFLESLASVVGVSVWLPAVDLWIGWQEITIAYIYALVPGGSIRIVGIIIAHWFPYPELGRF